MITTSLIVRHNIEVAHRLFETPGKCENIHGHSMFVNMLLEGPVDSKGFVLGLDFGEVKKLFRSYLDNIYDHQLLLNVKDPFAKSVLDYNEYYSGLSDAEFLQGSLPGLRQFNQDPTTENIAAEIGFWAQQNWIETTAIEITVEETAVNSAVWSWRL